MTHAQIADELAVAVADALHRAAWADGMVRVQHCRHAVQETLARCGVTLTPTPAPAQNDRHLTTAR